MATKETKSAAQAKTSEVKTEVKTADVKPAAAKTAAKKTPAKKTTAAKKPAAAKTAAKKAPAKKTAADAQSDIYIQFYGKQIAAKDILEECKADYKSSNKAAVKKIEIYVKPEDNKAYYVVNGKTEGKISL